MEDENVLGRIRTEGASFFEAVKGSSEPVYLVLFTLYVLIYLELKTVWVPELSRIIENLRFALLGIVMWGATLYLFFIIVSWKDLWKKSIVLILVGGIMLAGTWGFSRIMSTNSYGVVMDVFFCLMACGKSFRKMLKCILGATVSMLLIAWIGIQAGFTLDLGKPDTPIPGHSLGINYPNTWGYLVFLALIILWYLYLRFRPVITSAVFWAVSVFMYSYITCRTIAGIAIVFPVLALVTDQIEKLEDRKAAEGTFRRNRPLEWIITSIPFLSWAFMMFSSYQVEWWHRYYHGPLRNLAWRFLMGGLYFKKYGIPIVGNPYRSNQYTFVNVQGEFIKIGILDSSFAAYIIMRGALWLTYTLLWLCAAIWKALKKRDYAVILLETILLGFAMMERPGLEMWYNFILLYPLAKTVEKAGTEPAEPADNPETVPAVSGDSPETEEN